MSLPLATSRHRPRRGDERVDYLVELFRLYAGTAFAFDEARLRVACEAEVDRMWYPESGHSHAAWSTASRVDRLSRHRGADIDHARHARSGRPRRARATAWPRPSPTTSAGSSRASATRLPPPLTAELARRLLALFHRALRRSLPFCWRFPGVDTRKTTNRRTGYRGSSRWTEGSADRVGDVVRSAGGSGAT